MSTFVLVHGAWHGGWCWVRVTERLRARGHEVFTPSLSGLAEHGHRISADIGHDVHVEDVTRLIVWNELTQVILVGHSYGGLVVTGVAAGRARNRLAHLVVLDGSAPKSGECMLDLARAPVRQGFQAAMKDGLMTPPDMIAMGLLDPADAAWAEPKLTPHPAKTFTEPLVYDERKLAGLPKTFIRCLGADGTRPISISAERCKGNAEWRYHELRTGHDAMVTMPGEVSAILEEASKK